LAETLLGIETQNNFLGIANVVGPTLAETLLGIETDAVIETRAKRSPRPFYFG
jgi:hypothetical protein